MIYQGPRCNVVVLLPDEIFINVPLKMCGVPNPELRRGFLEVFNRWGRSEKKLIYLDSGKKFFSMTY